MALDITNAADIEKVAARLVHDYPSLIVLINNAGIMPFDDPAGRIDDAVSRSILDTNLLGPIRLTAAPSVTIPAAGSISWCMISMPASFRSDTSVKISCRCYDIAGSGASLNSPTAGRARQAMQQQPIPPPPPAAAAGRQRDQ
ncbi:short chain dehydrogenase [Azospirillum sp. RU38E]|nr:short chain dehydrogenase [Azospirillum sp. RU38E]SNS98608.1 short chain dehydrogenase [Azospirillum sp. RU37A]